MCHVERSKKKRCFCVQLLSTTPLNVGILKYLHFSCKSITWLCIPFRTNPFGPEAMTCNHGPRIAVVYLCNGDFVDISQHSHFSRQNFSSRSQSAQHSGPMKACGCIRR